MGHRHSHKSLSQYFHTCHLGSYLNISKDSLLLGSLDEQHSLYHHRQFHLSKSSQHIHHISVLFHQNNWYKQHHIFDIVENY